MLLQNVVLSFPTLFVPEIPKGGTNKRYDCNLLIAPNHPQLNEVVQLFNAAVAGGYPQGVPAGTNVCMGLYETRTDPTKNYYDPRFVGWTNVQVTRREAEGRPPVMDTSMVPVIDPAQVYSGAMVHCNFDITHYKKLGSVWFHDVELGW